MSCSSWSSKLAEAETGVFWDVVDCPIPDGVSLDLACENIKSALADDGYRGKVTIRAYCDTKERNLAVKSAFKSSGIRLKPAGDRRARRNAMLEDLYLFAVDHKPSSLMVILQGISKDSLLVENLVTLKDENCNLLLAQTDCLLTGDVFASVSSTWYWRDLSSGGKPALHLHGGSSQAVAPIRNRGHVDIDASGSSVANKRARN